MQQLRLYYKDSFFNTRCSPRWRLFWLREEHRPSLSRATDGCSIYIEPSLPAKITKPAPYTSNYLPDLPVGDEHWRRLPQSVRERCNGCDDRLPEQIEGLPHREPPVPEEFPLPPLLPLGAALLQDRPQW